jgi:hypothetical protein
MITQEKIAEVKKMLKRGVPDGEIRNELLSEGYTEEDIRVAFVPHKSEMGSWYLIFGIIVSLITLGQLAMNHILGSIIPFLCSGGLWYAYYKQLQEKSNQ